MGRRHVILENTSPWCLRFALGELHGFQQLIQLVRGAIESLTSAPPGTAVIVCVDDAHLLDDLSAFVMHQIVQRGAAKVMLTVRDGEPIPAGGPGPMERGGGSTVSIFRPL